MSNSEISFGSASTKGSSTLSSEARAVFEKYQIDEQYIPHFKKYKDFDLIILCDDSGSMMKTVSTGETRWQRLEKMLEIVVDVTSVLDTDGFDVYFLNRPPLLGIKNFDAIRSQFKIEPEPTNLTLMVKSLKEIFDVRGNKPKKRKYLQLVIATDGTPTDENNQDASAELEEFLKTKRTRYEYVTFLNCSDDDKAVEYLEKLDKTLPNIDTVDSYETELEQVKKERGENFTFPFGLYVCKAVLGASDSWFDQLDGKTEVKNNR